MFGAITSNHSEGVLPAFLRATKISGFRYLDDFQCGILKGFEEKHGFIREKETEKDTL